MVLDSDLAAATPARCRVGLETTNQVDRPAIQESCGVLRDVAAVHVPYEV